MNLNYDVLDHTEKMIYALRSLYAEYGYERYRMRKFEEYGLYWKNKDFLISDNVITFTDTNGKLMALKPDVTLSIIKNNRDLIHGVRKLCYNENVYRVSKGSNSFREIMQTGLECLGEIDDVCIGEVLTLASKSLSLASDSFMLNISNLDILSAFLDRMVLDAESRGELIKCISEKNLHGITAVCEASGIGPDQSEELKKLVNVYGPIDQAIPEIRTLCRDFPELAEKLEKAVSVFERSPLREKIRIDLSLVSNMKYYNGIIFKGFLNCVPESVLSGGQYDKLMKKLGRRNGAIGFAVYMDQLDRIEE